MAARAAADLPEVRALALVGFVPRWEHLPADTLDRLALYRGPVLAVCAETMTAAHRPTSRTFSPNWDLISPSRW